MAPARWVGRCAAAALVLGSLGCGDAKNKGPQLDLAPVAGTVTLDGQPLADADVAFYLEGAATPGYYGSGGKTDAQGRYALQTGAEGALCQAPSR